LKTGLGHDAISNIREKGAVIVRGVVSEAKVRPRSPSFFPLCCSNPVFQALEWLDRIKKYIALNPHVKGFPEKEKAVFEI
jgi:hypothetical protein